MALTSKQVAGRVDVPSTGAAGGQVIATMTTSLANPGDRLVASVPVTFEIDNAGNISGVLYATDDPGVNPDGVVYQLRIYANDRAGTVGQTTVRYVNLPHTAVEPYDIISNSVAAAPSVATTAYATQASVDALASGKADDSAVIHNAVLLANTILGAVVDYTPAALAVPPSSLFGRKATGNLGPLSVSEVGDLLGIDPTPLAVWSVAAGTYDAPNDRLTDLSGSGHHAVLGSAVGVDANDPARLSYDTVNGRYIRMASTAGNYLSVADTASLSITGDQSHAIAVAPDDWTPSSVITLCGKFEPNSNQRSWRLDLKANGTLQLFLSVDGTTSVSATSSVAVGATDGVLQEILWTWRASDGRVQFFKADAVGGTYTQIGTDQSAVVASVFDSTAPVGVNGYSSGTVQPGAFKLYRARHWSGLATVSGGVGDFSACTLVLDIDPADSSLAEPFAAFIEKAAGATVTINRSTSGRKTTVVDRTGLLFGTDDYAAVADAAVLDFAASESFSVTAAFRFQTAPSSSQVLIAKKADLTTGAGYALYLDSSGRLNGVIADGTTSTTVQSTALTSGVAYFVALVRDVTNDRIFLVVNDTATAAVTDTTTGSLANSEDLRIGRLSGAGTSYGDFYGFAWSLFSSPLSTTSVAALRSETFTGAASAYVARVSTYTAGTDDVITNYVGSEAFPRYVLDADGTMWLGSGTVAPVRFFFASRNIGGTPTGGSQRTFFGYEAGLGCSNYGNTFFGFRAGKGVIGNNNTAMGNTALSGGYVGNECVAIGNGALAHNVSGVTQTAVGTQALNACISGASNSAFGLESLSYLISGSYNDSFGYYGNTSWGDDNTTGPADQHHCATFGGFNGHIDGLVDGPNGTPVGSRASKHHSCAFGFHARFGGNYAGAFGPESRAYADGSWAFGVDHTGAAAVANAQDEFVLGTALHTVIARGVIKTGQGTLTAAGSWRLGAAATGGVQVEVDGTALVLASKTYVDAQVAGVTGGTSTLASFEIASAGAKAWANTNFNTFTVQNGAYHNAHRGSSGAQNDSVTFLTPVALTAGTWTLVLTYVSATSAGIYTIAVSSDDSSYTDVGTVDSYAASAVNFNRTELTGVTIAAGMKYVRLKMATKNASSSGYLGRHTSIAGVRTGA